MSLSMTMKRSKRQKRNKESEMQILLSTAIITDAVIACFCTMLYCIMPWLEQHIAWIRGNVWEFIEEVSLVGVVGALTAITGLSVIYIINFIYRHLKKKR